MSHNLVSMKRTASDKKSAEVADSVGGESFPYGLTISLDDESLTKLGITELPAVGEAMVVVGVGKVESVSKNSNQRRVSRNVSIQLERLEVGPLKSKTATDAVSEAVKAV